ncbi:MAG TPA: protoporphyrinogen oxidase [Bryobacteraceae bacterium]|nr:protoporphyrinogen oxidase [Bryobacteraceae bacterium]
MTHKVLIVGGGISGLSAAYYLSKGGIRARLLEKSPQPGGVIRTSIQHGCLLEGGPDSFIAAKPWAMDLIRELGMADQVIGSNDHLRVTYIVKKGRLVPLPDGLMMMVPTKILPLVGSSLLSWGTKIRMGLEFLRRPAGPQPDRSVYDFLLDHYGRESIDYLAEPLLAGVYGGDPREMSVNSVLARFVEIEAKYGSLTRGVLAAPRPKGSGSLFRTLKGGLQQLVDALQPSAEIQQAGADAIERNGSGFRVRVAGDWMEAEHVIVATPAVEATRLLRPTNPELSDLLSTIPYTSSITLSLGYRKDTFDHPLNGFGFLVPKLERKYMAACTWVGNKFSYRVPEDMVVLRCFLGGNALSLGDDALVEAARGELESIMGLRTAPVFSSIARWPNSMAQYSVGHEQRMARIDCILATIPGLHLAGNAYRGIGVPDCIRMGKEAAAGVTSSSIPELRPA